MPPLNSYAVRRQRTTEVFVTSDEAQSHYLDRVCESLRATGHQINRALYAYSLLSIVALASLLELIHTPAGYTLFGVSLTFSLPFLLLPSG